MGFFSRKKKQENVDVEVFEELTAPEQPETETGDQLETGEIEAGWEGPYAPEESAYEGDYVELGRIRIPMIEGLQMMPVLDDEQNITSLEILFGSSQVQVSAYAMRRSGGLWEETIEELEPQLREQGFETKRMRGPYGTALAATPQGLTATAPGATSLLLWGLEGDRCMTRLVFRGRAAEDAQARKELQPFVNALEVTRGEGAMAPGDLLPITLPQSVIEQAQELQEQE